MRRILSVSYGWSRWRWSLWSSSELRRRNPVKSASFWCVRGGLGGDWICGLECRRQESCSVGSRRFWDLSVKEACWTMLVVAAGGGGRLCSSTMWVGFWRLCEKSEGSLWGKRQRGEKRDDDEPFCVGGVEGEERQWWVGGKVFVFVLERRKGVFLLLFFLRLFREQDWRVVCWAKWKGYR